MLEPAELGIDHTIEKHERDMMTMLAPEALRKIHPFGSQSDSVPCSLQKCASLL